MSSQHYLIFVIKFICLFKIIATNLIVDYPKFQIKAILENCTNSNCNLTNVQIIIKNQSSTIETLTNCNQKLLLTIQITNEGIYQQRTHHYIIIDHIFDPIRNRKVKLLYPYVIKFRQDPVLELYDLNYERTVNGEAQELIFNHHNSGYKGCNLDSINPTCPQIQQINGKFIPYSTGFCCSCYQQKNQFDYNDDDDDDTVSLKLFGKFQPPKAEKKKRFISLTSYQGLDGKMVYGADKSVNYQQLLKDASATRQQRGGQDCGNTSIPEHLTKSTHCLQFSNVWYRIYGLNKPKIHHRIHLQIFQKYENHWKCLTGNKIICLDSQHPYSKDLDNIRIKYSVDESNVPSILNYKKHKLLIPEQSGNNYDPSEFMVVPNDMITYDGSSCNKIGVGYEAFYKQKKRCYTDKGSCLKNQPLHLYQNDINASERGENGRYFLKYYGQLPDADDTIGRNTSGHVKNIKFLYTQTHISYIDAQINADYLPLILSEMSVIINEIYTDTSDRKRIRIVVKVTNTGLLYGVFHVRLGECPLEIPASFNNIVTKSVLIPPQQQHIFDLFIHNCLETTFFCTIFVQNRHQEVVASRRIRFEKNDRCICVWYCKCTCYNTDKNLICHPLSLQAYQTAGYQGGLPIITKLLKPTKLDRILAELLYMFLFLIITLLLMGLIKAILGLCCKKIGNWGLDVILGRCTCENCQYRCQQQQVTLPAKFCLNVLFFFIYPLVIIRHFCVEKVTYEKPDYNEKFYFYPVGLVEEGESFVFTESMEDYDNREVINH